MPDFYLWTINCCAIREQPCRGSADLEIRVSRIEEQGKNGETTVKIYDQIYHQV